jgi:hypothetical protein
VGWGRRGGSVSGDCPRGTPGYPRVPRCIPGYPGVSRCTPSGYLGKPRGCPGGILGYPGGFPGYPVVPLGYPGVSRGTPGYPGCAGEAQILTLTFFYFVIPTVLAAQRLSRSSATSMPAAGPVPELRPHASYADLFSEWCLLPDGPADRDPAEGDDTL